MASNPIEFGVAFIPFECFETQSTIYIVVDVIRATSTIVTLFEQGCKRVFLTDDVQKVHEFHQTSAEKFLICAEDAVGRRLEGADFSPSLLGIQNNDSIEGSSVVIQTSNGTAAAHYLVEKGASSIYMGSLLNGRAVVEAALDQAQSTGEGITIVCAGRKNGKLVTLDDIYCAAKLMDHALAYAEQQGIALVLQDSAKFAYSQLSVYPTSEVALHASASAENLRKIQSTDDINLCAIENVSNLTPQLYDQQDYPFIEIRRN